MERGFSDAPRSGPQRHQGGDAPGLGGNNIPPLPPPSRGGGEQTPPPVPHSLTANVPSLRFSLPSPGNTQAKGKSRRESSVLGPATSRNGGQYRETRCCWGGLERQGVLWSNRPSYLLLLLHPGACRPPPLTGCRCRCCPGCRRLILSSTAALPVSSPPATPSSASLSLEGPSRAATPL